MVNSTTIQSQEKNLFRDNQNF